MAVDNADATVSIDTSAADIVDNDDELDLPLMSISGIIGYTPHRTQHVVVTPDGQHILYAVNNTIVAMHMSATQNDINNIMSASELESAPVIISGQSAPIAVMAISATGLLAVGSAGKMPILRLFDWTHSEHRLVACIISCAHSLSVLTFSADGSVLVVVGRDHSGRQVVAVYDVTQATADEDDDDDDDDESQDEEKENVVIDAKVSKARMGIVTLLARQTCEADIRRAVFNQFETTAINNQNSSTLSHFVSCGESNVRFWRIKGDRMPHTSLPLNEFARNTFTDLAFEPAFGAGDRTRQRLFVASSSGSIFQVDVEQRVLECVYKVDSSPIHSLSINEGFAVTGSDDGYVRVWPLDFSDFFLQAKHTAAVNTVALTADGLRVIVATDNGTIGCCDLSTTSYRTCLRSHTDVINAIAVDYGRDEFATVSNDHSIRVWALHTREQIYEFVVPNEHITAAAYRPSSYSSSPLSSSSSSTDRQFYHIACGFANGIVRILDVNDMQMTVEYRQHTVMVTALTYSRNGLYLYSLASDGSICCYDVIHDYMPIKMFAAKRPNAAQRLHPNFRMKAAHQSRILSLTDDGTILATTSYDGHSLVLLDIVTTAIIAEIDSLEYTIAAAQFINSDRVNINNQINIAELCIVLSDGSFMRYSISDLTNIKLLRRVITATRTYQRHADDEAENEWRCSSATVAPDSGAIAIMMTSSAPATAPILRIADFAGELPVETYLCHSGNTAEMTANAVWSSDGSHLMTIADETVWIWSRRRRDHHVDITQSTENVDRSVDTKSTAHSAYVPETKEQAETPKPSSSIYDDDAEVERKYDV